MITPGEVRAVREVKAGVQAEVCVAASSEHGSAIVRVTATSQAVQQAMKALKTAISMESRLLLEEILEDQREWDAGKVNS